MSLQLYEPNEETEQALLDWNRAWLAQAEMVPSTARLRGSYAAWLAEERQLRDPAYAAAKGWAPGHSYFLMGSPKGPALAMTNLRLCLTQGLLRCGGHIGYGTLPAQRRKGYATLALRLTMEKARGFGLHRVLLTCNKENIGSARTILACGGVLWDEIPREGGGLTQRYWIAL